MIPSVTTDKVPNPTYILEISKLVITGDFLLYWYHRLAHINRWFRNNIHDIHHTYSAVFSWAGTYIHPIEFTHTLDETLNWFDQNEIEFINSIPSCNFDENYVTDLFKKESRGSLFTRITNQISMIFNNLGSDGGLFVIVGRKK